MQGVDESQDQKPLSMKRDSGRTPFEPMTAKRDQYHQINKISATFGIGVMAPNRKLDLYVE